MDSAESRERRIHADGQTAVGPRILPVECAVALSYNGASQAVMMATPADLEDFARGFTLTEGIAAPEDILSIEVVPLEAGIDLQIWLRPEAAQHLAARRRTMAGPVGCGLCGIDSLAEALRRPPPVVSHLEIRPAQVLAAVSALTSYQPLQDQTRAVHAAAFWQPGRGIILAREDVGRHNALDKLAGALLAQGVDGGSGAVVMTSRVSLDLVQKLARIGASILIAVSAPTSAALDLAEAMGITVVAAARNSSFEVFTHPGRISDDPPATDEKGQGYGR